MKLRYLALILALILVIAPAHSQDFEFDFPEPSADFDGSEAQADFDGSEAQVDFDGSEAQADFDGSEAQVDFDGSEAQVDFDGSEGFIEEGFETPGTETPEIPEFEPPGFDFDNFNDFDDFDYFDFVPPGTYIPPDIDIPVNPLNQPAKWKPLQDKVIPKGSPDNTVVYKDLALQCTDPDDPVIMSVVSQHSYYSLAFSGFDLVIRGLKPDYTGTESVILSCNGVRASFRLKVEGPNQQAVWATLYDKAIPQGSPDNTVVYKDLALQCTDPDDPVVMSVISSHSNYALAFSGFDLVIRNLNPAYTGAETVKLSCNGVPNSFKLHVVPKAKPAEKKEEGAKLKIFISSIRIPDAFELLPGTVFPVTISFKNVGDKKLENVKVAVVIQDFGVRTSIGPVDLPVNQKASKTLYVELPEDIEPGTYPVRLTIQNSKTKRVVYREIDVLKE